MPSLQELLQQMSESSMPEEHKEMFEQAERLNEETNDQLDRMNITLEQRMMLRRLSRALTLAWSDYVKKLAEMGVGLSAYADLLGPAFDISRSHMEGTLRLMRAAQEKIEREWDSRHDESADENEPSDPVCPACGKRHPTIERL